MLTFCKMQLFLYFAYLRIDKTISTKCLILFITVKVNNCLLKYVPNGNPNPPQAAQVSEMAAYVLARDLFRLP